MSYCGTACEFKIIECLDYEEAKAAMGPGYWNPLGITAAYATRGIAVTQLKRSIRRDRAGYKQGQLFAVFCGHTGLGTPESPFKTYYQCLASKE